MFDGVLAEAEDDALAPLRAAMAHGGAALARTTHAMLASLAGDGCIAAAGAAPYLDLFGTVLGGYLMTRSALTASRHLADETGDGGFYAAKLATARFYADTVMVRTSGLEQAATSGAEAVDGFDRAYF